MFGPELSAFDVYFAVRLALVEFPQWRVRTDDAQWQERGELRVVAWHEDRPFACGGIFLQAQVTAERLHRGDALGLLFLGEQFRKAVKELERPDETRTLTRRRLDGVGS